MTQDDAAATSPVVGIDLGTTNSVVAGWVDGKVQVFAEDGTALVPSVVGIAPDGRLLVGLAAMNQLVAFPERTIASVKRRMGQAEMLTLADRTHTPQEVSAIILRTLKERAERALGCPVTRAVITVPAFFDELQRSATREAGELAGLTVERIINEPTAASLVYHAGSDERRQIMVYDLGGGTFDVSIVRSEGGVVEVLASKGDTSLGGDDFDAQLARHVADQFLEQHGVDLMDDSRTRWRLLTACERAKRKLSTATTARIAEEFIATVGEREVSLDVEIDRHDYEKLIADLVDQTVSCADDALRDSGLTLAQIDELILVGGSTRTPLVQERLRAEYAREPQWSVDPDVAVALGAATQAASIAGRQVGPVLVDVATHTLGVAAVEGEGYFDEELVFVPILRRNSPLPARYEDDFSTRHDGQEKVQICIYQGESPTLDENIELGEFFLEGLNASDGCDGRIVVRFELSVDGTLAVTAIERRTGISRKLAINNALSEMKRQSKTTAAERLADLEGFATTEIVEIEETEVPPNATRQQKTVSRAQQMLPTLGEEDAADVQRLLTQIDEAKASGDTAALDGVVAELDDLLFYIAG